ncbi:MAG: HlyD family secretion protein [Blastocatellia bacterium]
MKRFSGLILLALLIAAAFSPVDVPFRIESVARVMPQKQWVLLKTPDGSLTATLYDHRTELVRAQQGYQFDRGDQVQLHFKEDRQTGQAIRAGETVATISSNQLNEQLVRLRNQLAVEQAGRDVVATGQKPQILTQLEEEITLAGADLELRRKTLQRMKQLHEDGIIAVMQLEQAENAHNESMARLRVAQKALQVGATGEKPETVSFASSKIDALRKEIAFLENKQVRYTLNAPFDGQIRLESTTEGDRLLVEDTSAVVLQIPVRLGDSRFIRAGQTVEIQLPDRTGPLGATILDVGTRIEILNREQVVLVRATASQSAGLPQGQLLRCRIECGPVRVAEFLKRSIRW